MKYLEELNAEQKQAVLKNEGPLLVVAGAGSGKTKTVTYRIHHLIESGKTNAENILAITFTNKAAKEMKDRITKLRGGFNPNLPFVSTFHGLGAFLLRQFNSEVGLTKHFSILDQDDATSIFKKAMNSVGIDSKQWEPRKLMSRIDRNKGLLIDLGQGEESGSSFDDILYSVWREYERLKAKENSVDFGDLLLKSYQILEKNKQIRELLQNKWKYLHVDEYQDTNKAQYEIVRLLTNPETNNLCVVGDGDQNIYTWRGADIKNILRFEKDFPGAEVVILEKNYRSKKPILDAAEEVISKNKKRIPRKLTAERGDGEKITLYTAMDEMDEARYVAGEISKLVQKGTKASEVAVLFRTNFQSRVFEEAFLRADLDYKLLGVKFYERKEIKDILSYWRLVFNPVSGADLGRALGTPKRGFGKVALAKILAGQSDELSGKTKTEYQSFLKILNDLKELFVNNNVSEAIKKSLAITKIADFYESEGTEEALERLANLKELVSVATKYDHLECEEGVLKLLEDASLASEQDGLGQIENKEMVTLMTVHASKGLEFEVVFVVGLEHGLFPSVRDGEKKEDDEEERRLFYVAVTRAKDKLYLTHALTRRIFGSQSFQSPSEFISDIPANLIENSGNSDYGAPIKTIYLDF